MIRYEIHSNVAASEQGLQHHPELEDLAQHLRFHDLEVRFVKQVTREEEEINVASAQFARGVKVRGTAVRTVRSESNLRGLMTWLRAVAARMDRGLHLELDAYRATNGVPLVLGQLFARGHRAFLSGVDESSWRRLCAQPDPSLQREPEEIAASTELRNDYLMRRVRRTGFFNTLQQLAVLEFLPAEQRERFREMARTRDEAAADRLTETQVVNIGLISDLVERYQRLLEQFFALIRVAESASDLPALFELLTQGLSFDALRAKLEPFCLETKREQIGDKRRLVNEVRIGLHHGEDALQTQFERQFASLVLAQRLQRDPAIYRRMIVLRPVHSEELEVLQPARDQFARLYALCQPLRETELAPATPVPQQAKQKLFELVVSLVYLAQYQGRHREDNVPVGARTARWLLTVFRFKELNVAQLRSLNPKLPVRGVARNLAEKTPMTLEELQGIERGLMKALFPMERVTGKLYQEIHARYRDQVSQQQAAQVDAFMLGAYPLLSYTNYVMGRTGQTGLMWRAGFHAVRTLGLTVLESRDQIRSQDVLRRQRDSRAQPVEGYLLLMNREDARFFPLGAPPEALRRAYQFLYTDRVVYLVRRMVAHKIKHLFDRHGARLFEALYQRLVWEYGLQLSREQLGHILTHGGVFERDRLREFGFHPRRMANARDWENPWLAAAALDGDGDDERNPFFGPRVEQRYRASYTGFNDRLQRYRDRTGEQRDGHSLPATLMRLAGEEVYDLRVPRAQEALGETDAAVALWKHLQETVSQHFKTIFAEVSATDEAISFRFPQQLAYLTLLRPDHTFRIEERTLLFRLEPAWEDTVEQLDGPSQVVAQALAQTVQQDSGGVLATAIETIQVHLQLWGELVHAAMPLVIDQMLRESVLSLVKPAPPYAKDVPAMNEEQVMCLGTSSMDQGKFHRMVAHPERRDVYATISELTSWLARFQRMREELEHYRELVADILAIVDSFNLSVFDAPYVARYASQLRKLDEALSVRPEDMSREDLEAIEALAMELSRMVREIHEKELRLRFRDRMLSRVTIRLRNLRPNTRLNFVDALYERAAEQRQDEDEGEEAAAQRQQHTEEYQTFSERVRNVIAFRERLQGKQVFVVSPANNQERLTLSLIDQLYRLKGIFIPILVDIAGCEAFVSALRTRIPPHRLFNLNQMRQ